MTTYMLERHDSRLGRHVNHDPRSLAFKYRAGPVSPLVDVRHPIGMEVLDQGQVGSCVGNAFTHLLSTEPFKSTLPVDVHLGEEFARDDLYSDFTHNDQFPGAFKPDDTGTDGTTAGNRLTTRGFIAGFEHAMGITAFLAALQDHAVPIGIKWLESCYKPDANGLIRYEGALAGGHELLADEYLAAPQLVGLQNSWNRTWGVDGGRCYISVADLGRALADGGDATVCVPITQPAPQPQPPQADPDIAAWWADTKDWSEHPHLWHKATVAARAANTLAARKGFS